MTSRDHFGPLPEAVYDGTTRSGKFLDVEIIGTIYVGGDATISGDITTNNLTATGGTLGGLTINGTITVATGGSLIITGTGVVASADPAAAGLRYELGATDTYAHVDFFTGHASETAEGYIRQIGGAVPIMAIKTPTVTGVSSALQMTGDTVTLAGSVSSTIITAATNVQVQATNGALELIAYAASTQVKLWVDVGTSGSDGTAALPALSFTNDPNTGIFRRSADQLAFSTNGTEAYYIDANGNIIGNTMAMVGIDYIRAGDGSAGAPTYTFTSDTNTGMYWVAADQLGFSTGGTARVSITGTRTDIDTVFLQLPVKATTGDPSSPQNGDCYVNTFDNKIRVYADAAWRDLATW